MIFSVLGSPVVPKKVKADGKIFVDNLGSASNFITTYPPEIAINVLTTVGVFITAGPVQMDLVVLNFGKAFN